MNFLSLFQIFDICLFFINDKERLISDFMLACFIAVYSMGFVYWSLNIFVKLYDFNLFSDSLKTSLMLLSLLLGVVLARLIRSKRNEFYSNYLKLEPIILTLWFKLIFAFVVVFAGILNIIVGIKFGHIVLLVYSLELIIIPYCFFWFAKTQDEI